MFRLRLLVGLAGRGEWAGGVLKYGWGWRMAPWWRRLVLGGAK